MIEVRDLRVWHHTAGRRVETVRGVSFSVAPGESFGLVGNSGCGKSTVLRALVGLAPDWSGSVRLGGVAPSDLSPKALARRVQMVFQDPYGSLHPRHTVDQALSEPLLIHGLGRERDARVCRALADVGLDPQVRFRLPHQLSGGQRQRVAIARALMLDPPLVLLDEPTSALDVSVQAEILNLLQRLRHERGLTLVLVSHNLAVVHHLTDRRARMQDGQLIEP
ncbi:ABC transporter ATP-binding protein [Pararhodospirillum photometricum]|uniref:Glutathione import ATP-binding protein GsiA n=1 Tax=Pararhodospirillum photometricum DSM 122 TaxID=1150469 RepID=H6SPA5_PARPM|nr:ABC transporter ATP-binding protein [Pararhodospirillum photometricum]CCG09430.1 ABC transporter component [Pararhodospirillum photometricum DSM 122]